KRAYCLKTQPATGETYPKSDLFNKAAQTYSESFFTDEDNDNPACHMSAVIFDYARELCTDLKAIENKIG
ncbi:hypothetical protein V6157_24545, partial [Klebsiella pneumoniae]